MWRDLGQYLRALWKHWLSLIAGPTVTVALLIWQVFEQANIPTWVFWAIAAPSVPVAGFLAWRDEHQKVPRKAIDPEVELRRSQFEKEIAKLSPLQQVVLHHVVRCGDRDAAQVREFFREHYVEVSPKEADGLLAAITDMTGLLEVKATSNAYERYGIKSVWEKLLVEWAAPPTALDQRIIDKARQLRRQLTASFEDCPPGPRTLDDHLSWARLLAGGFDVTDPGLRELVDLRPGASRRIWVAVGLARDAFDKTADLVNPLGKQPWWIVGGAPPADVEVELRQAAAHFGDCLNALDTVTRDLTVLPGT
jgi:hypothetical protein